VLDSANRVAGQPVAATRRRSSVGIRPDSLSFFAFILDLERSCGIKFDDTLLNQEHLHSIRSAAALMQSLHAASETGNSAGVGNQLS
jgi:hypothetical protein